MLKIWKNTNTLDGLVDDLVFTENKYEANVALLGSKPINLDEFPGLRGIFRAGVGQDNVPLEQAQKRGIKVVFPSRDTIRYIYEETADFTCYLILKMVYSQVGTLSPWVKFPRMALKDRQLLLIGLGNIGSRVQEKMKLFMNVLTYDVLENSARDLPNLLSRADAVSLHIPNSPENREFMNAERLALMKDHAVLINTARGALVSEIALEKELENNRLAAAFDVFWQEPYEGRLKRFHPYPFFLTPHVASTCNAFLEGSAMDLRRLLTEISAR